MDRSIEALPELKVAVHPLVILEISDHIARKTIRVEENEATEPIIGVVLGKLKDDTAIIEKSFNISVSVGPDGRMTADERAVKAWDDLNTTSNVIGYYTPMPPSGPTQTHVPLHNVISAIFPARLLILIAFHPTAASSPTSPITPYLTNAMLNIEPIFPRISHLSIIGTPAETVALNTIVLGSGNALAIPDPTAPLPPSQLTRQESDAIALLETKAAATRVLKSNLHLLSSYLSQLSSPTPAAPLSPTILRYMLATITSLGLSTPSDTDAFTRQLTTVESSARATQLLTSLLGAAAATRKATRTVQLVTGTGIGAVVGRSAARPTVTSRFDEIVGMGKKPRSASGGFGY